MRLVIFVVAAVGFIVPGFCDDVRLAEIKKLKQSLGILPEYEHIPGVEDVRVAILDNGFAGLMEVDQNYLPNLKIFAKEEQSEPEALPPEEDATPENVWASPATSILVNLFAPAWLAKYPSTYAGGEQDDYQATAHGRTMAVIGRSLSAARLLMLHAVYPRSFCRAIQFATDTGVDAIVHSKVFEQFGNMDGSGPLEQCIQVATRRGIKFFNAAGNYGKKVYRAPLKEALGKLLRLRSNFQTEVEITLNWNRWGSSFDTSGTDLDLDLILFAEDPLRPGNQIEIARSDYRQRDVPSVEIDDNTERRLPFEKIPNTKDGKNRVRLEVGKDYKIRVALKNPNQTFLPEDEVTVTVFSATPPQRNPSTLVTVDAIDFIDATRKNEVLTPADSKQVITVGANSPQSALSATKPNIVMPLYTAQMTNADLSEGSSESNAIFGAGIYPYLLAASRAVNRESELTRDTLLSFTKVQRIDAANVGLGRGEWTPEPLPSNATRIDYYSLKSTGRQGLKGLADTVLNAGGTNLKIWKLYNPERYVITIKENPGRLAATGAKKLFGLTLDSSARPHHYDAYQYYLVWQEFQFRDRYGDLQIESRVNSSNRLRAALVDTRTNRDPNDRQYEPYPWEKQGGRALDHVEVRRDPDLAEAAEGQDLALWQTPKLVDLFTKLGVADAAAKAEQYQ